MDRRRSRVRGPTDRRRAPLTAAESRLAKEVAERVGALRASGCGWENILISLDRIWPQLPYRIAVTAIFWAQLAYERRRQVRALQ